MKPGNSMIDGKRDLEHGAVHVLLRIAVLVDWPRW
jgi:hypothetical protein